MSKYPPAQMPALSAESSAAFLGRTAAYVRHAPFALAIRELNRLLAMEMLDAEQPKLRSPVLDVGCGDGFWWTLPGRHRPEVYGVDIAESEVEQAKQHIHAEVCDISKQVPFPGVKFQDLIGNCSLEHVRNIDAALHNLYESAANGARLVLFVPAPEWAFHGRIQKALMGLSPRLAMMASGMANGFFQHWHLYSPEVWAGTLQRNGWKLKTLYGLGNSRSEFLFRLFLPQAFLGFLAKVATGVYPNRLLRDVPEALFAPLQKLLAWGLASPLVPADDPDVYEFVLVCEKDDVAE
ncbi:MAG: class I SAM-dependent methyltransferase [Myxococcales bacterium]|nr:class I SAM-dependent methyltransferase [Myxococcales bacterium]